MQRVSQVRVPQTRSTADPWVIEPHRGNNIINDGGKGKKKGVLSPRVQYGLFVFIS